MKVNSSIYYIKKEKWDEFLLKYHEYGFVREGRFAYPDYVQRPEAEYEVVRVYISDPVINMWDDEDKMRQREIWIRHNHSGVEEGGREEIKDYIQDLIDAGFVE